MYAGWIWSYRGDRYGSVPVRAIGMCRLSRSPSATRGRPPSRYRSGACESLPSAVEARGFGHLGRVRRSTGVRSPQTVSQPCSNVSAADSSAQMGIRQKWKWHPASLRCASSGRRQAHAADVPIPSRHCVCYRHLETGWGWKLCALKVQVNKCSLRGCNMRQDG